MNKRFFIHFGVCVALLFTGVSCREQSRNGSCTLHVLTTSDTHGAWFDSSYVSKSLRPSLLSVSACVDSVRRVHGAENVLLLDAGDFLQGDNAVYYYNYVKSADKHLYPKLADYMGYDAVVIGNHDIEAGSEVYSKVSKELERKGIAVLAGNAVDAKGKHCWDEYTVVQRAGLKVLILGYTNPNMKAWLDDSILQGMEFSNLLPLVQRRVNRIKAKVNPDVTIVAVHSGAGKGDGDILESQGLDLFNSLKGVDLVLSAHDHSPKAIQRDSILFLNSGSRCSAIGHAIVRVTLENDRVVDKKLAAGLIRPDKKRVNTAMKEEFNDAFRKVKMWTLEPMGRTESAMVTRESFSGPSFYMNLIHKAQLEASGAQISFAAPIAYDKTFNKGPLGRQDMFDIYPYENRLVKMNLYGREILDYLEYSYDAWITKAASGHVLNIQQKSDARTGSKGWSFVARSYNFDSAAGIKYTVDVNGHYGSRVEISSLSSGKAFCLDSLYTVALNSYRAAGGGDFMYQGCHLLKEEIEQRTIASYKDIRSIVTEHIQEKGTIRESDYRDIGSWYFIPREKAGAILRNDMNLLFTR